MRSLHAGVKCFLFFDVEKMRMTGGPAPALSRDYRTCGKAT